MSYKSLFKRKLPILSLIALAIAYGLISMILSGCAGQPGGADSSNGKLKVIATTTMLADLAKEIGGEHVDASGLMGPGIDPHLYQASAGDVTKLQEADVVLYNGLHLEGKMGDIFASLEGQGRDIICIEKGLDASSLLEAEDNPQIHDPHIWFDVSLWKKAAEYTADRLSEIDPSHAEEYAANLERYSRSLDELDGYIRSRIKELPQQQRVLVTAHDAFRYFGAAYEFDVKGLQGISTEAEAGTADVSSLADFIAQNRIKAIFVESSVPPKNIEALKEAVKARGFSVEIGGELYSDSLGDKASGHDTYILTLRANIDTIVDALK